MNPSLSAFLQNVRERGVELPPALSSAILLAAVRQSDEHRLAVRPDLLQVDQAGQLRLHIEGARPTDDVYAAPELRRNAAAADDGRVLVYAAGALGYELVTLSAPPGGAPGPELKGPLAPVIRKALSLDRKKRYRKLEDMAEALQAVQVAPSEDEVKRLLSALATGTGRRKLGRVRLRTVSTGKERPEPGADVAPLLGEHWDPLSASEGVLSNVPAAKPALPGKIVEGEEPVVVAEPGAAPAPPPRGAAPTAPAPPGKDAAWMAQVELAMQEVAELRKHLGQEKEAREDAVLRIQARLETLARLASRLMELEQQVARMPEPEDIPLARRARELLDDRRYADAEKLLQHPLAEGDAVLQLRLAQAIAAQGDGDASRNLRAEASFRRAIELDPGWAHAKALFGAYLLRLGKLNQAKGLLHAALAVDPACPEARAALPPPVPPVPRRPAFLAGAAGAVVGATAMALVAAVLRNPPPAPVASAEAAPAPSLPALAPLRIAAATPIEMPQIGPEGGPPKAVPQTRKAVAAAPPRTRRSVAAAHPRAALEQAAKGDQALRAFDTQAALTAFQSALQIDARLPSAHRGMGMVYVLQGKTADAKAEYRKYLELAPDAPDREQIQRVLSR